MTASISLQRLRPARPSKASTPPPTDPRMGWPLKNLETAIRSHTEPIAWTMVKLPSSDRTDSSVGFSATTSGTPIRSWRWSSDGSQRCADPAVSAAQPG